MWESGCMDMATHTSVFHLDTAHSPPDRPDSNMYTNITKRSVACSRITKRHNHTYTQLYSDSPPVLLPKPLDRGLLLSRRRLLAEAARPAQVLVAISSKRLVLLWLSSLMMSTRSFGRSMLATDGNDAVSQRALVHHNDDHVVLLVLIDLVIDLLIHESRP